MNDHVRQLWLQKNKLAVAFKDDTSIAGMQVVNGNAAFNMFSGVNRCTYNYLAGKRIPYLTTTPKHHKGNRYIFQFQGSGGFDLKQRVKES